MRAVPIPDGVAEAAGGVRVVIGEPGDPTRTDVRPCEYIVRPSELYPGGHTFTVLVVLDDDERAAVADGHWVALTLDGAEVPWSLQVVPPAGIEPAPAR